MENDLKFRNHEWTCAYKFMKWGIGFFIFGFLVGFGILIHYLMGSRYQTSDRFLTNMTLWFGSPLSLSASYLQVGGLAMAAIGAAKLLVAKFTCCDTSTTGSTTHVHTAACATSGCGTTPGYGSSSYIHHRHFSLSLCNFGLIALFLTGYVGYFIINAIWPGFYYVPIDAGKNLWLVLQGLSLLCFLFGLVGAYNSVCKCRHCK